ncbi:MAG: mannose-1-phosphate guanylyltransferase, partial [Flavobacteriaceae bacterium]
EKLPKNENKNAIVNAKVISEKSKNNIIRTEGKKLVVLKGLSNYIVVETDDVLMIYPKKEEQNIKEIVQKNGL